MGCGDLADVVGGQVEDGDDLLADGVADNKWCLPEKLQH